MNNDIPKPLTKAETRKLEQQAAKVGKVAPAYTGVQYGAQIFYHEGQKSGYGALIEPSSHSKYTHLRMFSFKVTGTKCEITSCEYDYVHVSQIEDYLNGDERGVEAEPLQVVKDCIDEFLTSKGIGITQFI